MTMSKEKFKEDFEKRLIKLSVDTLKFSEELQKAKLWSLSDQLVRSTTSIGANVVEAKSSSSKREYIHFFQIALKSANESKYWLIVLGGYSEELQVEAENIQQEVEEIAKIIATSILTMKGKR